MKYLGILVTIIIISSCATYSPEQLQAKASDKTDIQLCFDMVLPNPNMYSKQELMNREVDCNKPSIAEAVMEKRKKQIQAGQMLMAFGNAMQGQTQPTYMPSLGTLPNYSNTKTMSMMYTLTNNYMSGSNRICIYSLGSLTATHTIQGVGLCPITMNF